MTTLEPRVEGRPRSHEARTHRRHEDVLAGQLAAKSGREAGQRKRAGAVRYEMRYPDLAADRGDIHDAAAAVLSHVRNSCADRVQRTPEMCRHRFVVIGDSHVLDG